MMESGTLPIISPLVLKELCDYCHCYPPTGQIGSMTDKNWSADVCESCYHNVLHMRPLGENCKCPYHQAYPKFTPWS